MQQFSKSGRLLSETIPFSYFEELRQAIAKAMISLKFQWHFVTILASAEARSPGFLGSSEKHGGYWNFVRRELLVFVPMSMIYARGELVIDHKGKSIAVPGRFLLKKQRVHWPALECEDWSWSAEKLLELAEREGINAITCGVAAYAAAHSYETQHYENVAKADADQALRIGLKMGSVCFKPMQAFSEGTSLRELLDLPPVYKVAPFSFLRDMTPQEIERYGLGPDSGAREIAQRVFGLASFAGLIDCVRIADHLFLYERMKEFHTVRAGKLDHSDLKQALGSLKKGRLRFSDFAALDFTVEHPVVRFFQRTLQLRYFEVRDGMDCLRMLVAASILPEWERIRTNFKKWADKADAESRMFRTHDYLLGSLNRLGLRGKGGTIHTDFELPEVTFEPAEALDEWEVLLPRRSRDILTIGRAQKHCVYRARYDRRILAREAIIFSVYPKGGALEEGVTCELSPSSRSIRQVEGFRRRRPTAKELSAIDEVRRTIRFA